MSERTLGGGATPGPGTTPGAGVAGAIEANTRYVAEQDSTKAQAIATRMWGTATAVGCWYMKGSSDNHTMAIAQVYNGKLMINWYEASATCV